MSSNTTFRVRDALRWPLPTLRFPNEEEARPDKRTRELVSQASPHVPKLVDWVEFQRDTLYRIFKHELDQPYPWARPQHPLPGDRLVCSTDTVMLAYEKLVLPVVNNALHRQFGRPFYSVGSRFNASDARWVCLGGKQGDASFDVRFGGEAVFVSHGDAADDTVALHWATFRKIETYAHNRHVRYGFFASQNSVAIYQFQTSRDAQGQKTIPNSRPMVSGSVRFVHWNPQNRDSLTVPEALFFLALMAANGDNHLDTHYPKLDTYERRLSSYRHVTSGHDADMVRGTLREKPGVYHNDRGITDTTGADDARDDARDGPSDTQAEASDISETSSESPEPEAGPEASTASTTGTVSPPPSVIMRVPEPAPSTAADVEDWRERIGMRPTRPTRPTRPMRPAEEDAPSFRDDGSEPEQQDSDIGRDWVRVRIKRSKNYPMTVISPLYFMTVKDHVAHTKRNDWEKIRDGLYKQVRKGVTYYTTEIPSVR